jgi:hypothetical protein
LGLPWDSQGILLAHPKVSQSASQEMQLGVKVTEVSLDTQEMRTATDRSSEMDWATVEGEAQVQEMGAKLVSPDASAQRLVCE